MRRLFLFTCLVAVVSFQCLVVTAQADKKAEIRQIDKYCKSVDKLFERSNSAHLVFADVSQNRKAKWRQFKSEKALENFRENTETYSIAYNWLKNRKIVRSNFTLFSGSGDWAQYVYHHFRPDGTLAKAESELRTFHGDMIVTQIFYFDGKGRTLEKTLRYADLKNQKLAKPNDEFIDAHSDFLKEVNYYKKTTKLPFSHLLAKR